MVLAVAVLLAMGLVGASIGIYNRLVRKRNAVERAWAQIDAQLRRRDDLVPHLIDAAKRYVHREQRTFESVTASRAAANQASGPAERAQAENALTAALRNVSVVADSYPQLQASRNFAELQAEFSDTENRIAYSRKYYNDAVLAYNGAVRAVPSSLVAGIAGFHARELFSTPEVERGAVHV